MFITLEELLNADFFGEARVACGAGGITNNVTSFNILESAHGYIFTEKNMLVLTSGDFFINNAESRKSLIPTLVEKQASGLILNGTYESVDDVPDDIKGPADANGFPVVLIPLMARPYKDFFHFYDSYIYARGTREFLPKSRMSAYFLQKINEEGVSDLCRQLSLYTDRSVIFRFQDSISCYPNQSTELYEAACLDKIETQRHLIKHHPDIRLAADPLSAIGLSITYHGRSVGSIWIDTSNRPYDDNDVHLLEAARIAGELNIQQLFFYNENEAKLRNFLVTKLLQGKSDNINELMLLARSVNWKIPSQLRMIAISADDMTAIRPTIRNAIAEFSRKNHLALQDQNYSDAIILFMPDDEDYKKNMDELNSCIHTVLPDSTIYIGIGSRVSISDASLSLKQALFTIDIETKTDCPETILCFEDAGVYRLCFPDTMSPELPDICRRILTPLFEMDASSKLNLITTLSTYFSNDCCYTDTAKKLHVHPNTIRYRLGLVEETLGINLNRYSDMMELHLALKLLPLLNL